MQPQDSPIKLTPEQENHINGLASVEQISAYLRQCAVDQGLVKQIDPTFAPDLLVDAAPGTAPKAFARTVVIQGQKFILEGGSEAELDRREIEARRVAETNDQPARDANGRFVKTADAEQQQQTVDKVELELKFRRGELTAAEFIEQSGAIKDALDEMGVSEILEERQGQKEIQSWQDATEKFLRSEDGGGLAWD